MSISLHTGTLFSWYACDIFRLETEGSTVLCAS